MASLPIGRSLEPFDPQTEDFEAYAERLEQYLLVNDVSDKKKQRLLSEANLTAERALEISQAMETVEKGAKGFKEEHQDSKRQETETAAINVCHKCKRVGHLARACRSSGSKKETTHRVTEPQEQEYRLDYIGVLKGINTKRHVISRNGICTSPNKIEVIQKAPIPLNVTELRSFLGMVNYYGKFIQSVADLCAPLNELLQKNTPWMWTATCMESFNQLKQALGSAEVLCHYNPSEEISLACDASAHGLGAVLSHHFKDGSERPISYASRTLSKAERNYSQIEKEALSIIFGLKKCHQYLYGRKFLLVTDHQPLVKIFGPKTGISSVVAGRLQRWALCLAGYQYDIVYKPTQKHGNADGLSRYPSTESEAIDGEERGDRILALYGPQLAACPLTAKDIERGTMSDALLRQVLKFTKDGWNKTGRVDDQLRPYFNRREELSTEGNFLMWGIKAVIPPGMRQHILKELHQSHPGIV
ncbi:hypothetical protein EMCRGX_G017202 [Ephydatia muelleri]